MKIRVVLADDHQVVRTGFRAILEQQPGIEVIGEAGDGDEAVRLCSELHPEVLIADITMPRLNGIDAVRKMRDSGLSVPSVALSMHSDQRFVKQALQAGFLGYVTKDCTASELVTAVRTVHRGQAYVSPSVAGGLVNDYVRTLERKESAAGGSGKALSAREREVLQLIGEGRSTRQIATLLNVSVKTVETHRRKIMEKTGAASIAALTKYAIREGLTELED